MSNVLQDTTQIVHLQQQLEADPVQEGTRIRTVRKQHALTIRARETQELAGVLAKTLRESMENPVDK